MKNVMKICFVALIAPAFVFAADSAPSTSNPTVGQGNELTGTVEAYDAKANTINVRNADGTVSQIKVSKTTALSNEAGNKAAVNTLKNGDRIVYVRDNKGGIKTIQVKEGESTIR